jgi:hypothetical protein
MSTSDPSVSLPAVERLGPLLARPGLAAADLVSALLAFPGRIGGNDHARIAAVLAEASRELAPHLGPAEVFDRFGTVHPDLVRRLAPWAAPGFARRSRPPEETTLLGSGRNPWHEPDLTARFRAAGGVAVASSLLADRHPAFTLLERDDAELSVVGSEYVTLDRRDHGFVQWLSTRNVPLRLMPRQVADVPGDLVILRDIYGLTNFAHFLVDALPRLLMLVEHRPELARRAYFYCGPRGSAMTRLILSEISRRFRIDPVRFLFVPPGIVLRPSGRVVGFSDQVRARFHPALGGHPDMVQRLRRFLLSLPLAVETGAPKIYVSRRDAKWRRIVNEADLAPALARRGYTVVAFGDLPLDRQIAIARGAEVMIGPHGMGFAHLVFHPGHPRAGEIFHPSIGTMAYRTLVRAIGGVHGFAVGTVAPHPNPAQGVVVSPQVLDQLIDAVSGPAAETP